MKLWTRFSSEMYTSLGSFGGQLQAETKLWFFGGRKLSKYVRNNSKDIYLLYIPSQLSNPKEV